MSHSSADDEDAFGALRHLGHTLVSSARCTHGDLTDALGKALPSLGPRRRLFHRGSGRSPFPSFHRQDGQNFGGRRSRKSSPPGFIITCLHRFALQVGNEVLDCDLEGLFEAFIKASRYERRRPPQRSPL